MAESKEARYKALDATRDQSVSSNHLYTAVGDQTVAASVY
jgi:hypothetical protein